MSSGGTEPTESGDSVSEEASWPAECETSLQAPGCQEALIAKHTREVCEKNSVAVACAGGIATQLRMDDTDDVRLREYASTACEEGLERGCLLEARFLLQDETPTSYRAARETFQRLCSADQPRNCMVAGDALLAVGAPSETARPFLDKACQNGVPAGCRLLGVAYRKEGKDGSNAFEKGCFAGDVPSCEVLQTSSLRDPDWALLPEIGMTRGELVDTARNDCRSAKQPDCVLWAQIVRRRLPPDEGGRLAERMWELGCQAGAPDACFFSRKQDS